MPDTTAASSIGPGHCCKGAIYSLIDEAHGSVCQHEGPPPQGGGPVTGTVNPLSFIRPIGNSGSPDGTA
jgi:hypothetical protein